MTSIVEVLRGEMIAETGMDALGYSQPDKDRILVRKELEGEARKEVLGHEFEHITKGEEGPFPWAPVLMGGATLLSGILGSNATDRASNAVAAGNQSAIDEQRRQFDATMALLNPSIQTGNAARNQLAMLFGLPTSGGSGGAPSYGGGGSSPYGTNPAGFPNPGPSYFYQPGGGSGYNSGGVHFSPGANQGRQSGSADIIDVMVDSSPGSEPGSALQAGPARQAEISQAQNYYYGGGGVTGGGDIAQNQAQAMASFFTSPNYQFTLDESTRAVEGGAAAQGGALSGGAMRAIQERGANIASGEFQTYVNNLLNLAGGGQAATGQAVNVTQNTGGNVSSLLNATGNARASGIMGQANTLGNTINSLGFLLGNTDFGGGGGGNLGTVFGVDSDVLDMIGLS